MYGKHFASTYTGSMVGAGPVVFAVWGYIIANVNKSIIELNPIVLSVILGCSCQEIEKAIEYLCASDPKSRNKEFEGRRLIQEGEYQYFVTGHKTYRNMISDEDRKTYNRNAKRKERSKNKSNDMSNVKQCQEMSNAMSNNTNTNTNPNTNTDKDIAIAIEEKKEISSPELLKLGLQINDLLSQEFKPFTDLEEKTFCRLSRHLTTFAKSHNNPDFLAKLSRMIYLAKQQHINCPKAMFVELCKQETGYKPTEKILS